MVMCNHQQTFWDEGLKKVEKCSDNCNGSLGPYMRGICEKWCNGKSWEDFILKIAITRTI